MTTLRTAVAARGVLAAPSAAFAADKAITVGEPSPPPLVDIKSIFSDDLAQGDRSRS